MTAEDRIIQAFRQYGFGSARSFVYQSKLGVVAEGPTIGQSLRRKKAFYVEGSPYQMGYLVGRLAPEDVRQMAEDFTDRIVLDFLHEGLGEKLPFIGKLIVWLMEGLVAIEHVQRDLPEDQLSEIAGLAQACVDAGLYAEKGKRQLQRRLVILNGGIDVLLSMIYPLELPSALRRQLSDARCRGSLSRDLWDRSLAGDEEDEAALGMRIDTVLENWLGLEALFAALKFEAAEKLAAEHPHFRIPLACNAFSVFGSATKSGHDHYFGRDFAFPTAGIFQETACILIRRPEPTSPLPSRATLSVTAPGIVGSIMALSEQGVAAGVDMVPAACCNPARPGVNSLMLVRHAVEHADTGSAARELVVGAQRGVSWLYPMSYRERSTGRDEGWVIEAGETATRIDALGYTPLTLRRLLPTQAYLDAHPGPAAQQGVVVRMAGYRLEPEWNTTFNPGLFEHFHVNYDPSEFAPTGTLTAEPKSYYFAPQREERGELVMATNGYVVPLMRLTSMSRAPVLVTGDQYRDIQHRYDVLNARLLDSIARGGVDLAEAHRALERLSQPDATPTTVIEGSTTIVELHSAELLTHTHIGYFGDEWVTMGLAPFLS